MGAHVLLTVGLRQRPSAEPKPEGDQPVSADPAERRYDADAPGPVRRGVVVLALCRSSLSIAFGVLASWAGHAVAGARHHLGEQIAHGGQEAGPRASSRDRLGLSPAAAGGKAGATSAAGQRGRGSSRSISLRMMP